MDRRMFWALLLLVALLGLPSCSQAPAARASQGEPARVEKVAGTDLSRVILTAKAAERLAIATATVADAPIGGAQRRVIPYGALLYDARGATWVYTNPEPLVYVRQSVGVESIQGDRVILSDGPTAGTAVVIVGAAELLGTEMGVGH